MLLAQAGPPARETALGSCLRLPAADRSLIEFRHHSLKASTIESWSSPVDVAVSNSTARDRISTPAWCRASITCRPCGLRTSLWPPPDRPMWMTHPVWDGSQTRVCDTGPQVTSSSLFRCEPQRHSAICTGGRDPVLCQAFLLIWQGNRVIASGA